MPPVPRALCPQPVPLVPLQRLRRLLQLQRLCVRLRGALLRHMRCVQRGQLLQLGPGGPNIALGQHVGRAALGHSQRCVLPKD